MCNTASLSLRTTNRPWSGMVRSFNPLKIFGAPIISLERLNLVVKFCTQVGYINSSNMMTLSPTEWAWLWSGDCFKILPVVVMQPVVRVCLLFMRQTRSIHTILEVCEFRFWQFPNCACHVFPRIITRIRTDLKLICIDCISSINETWNIN